MNKNWLLWTSCAVVAALTTFGAPTNNLPRKPNSWAFPGSTLKRLMFEGEVYPDEQKDGMFIKGEAAPQGELPLVVRAARQGEYTVPLKRSTGIPDTFQINVNDWTNYHTVALTNYFYIAYPDSVYRETNKWRAMTVYHWWTWTNGSHLFRVTNATAIMMPAAQTVLSFEIKADGRSLTSQSVGFDSPL